MGGDRDEREDESEPTYQAFASSDVDRLAKKKDEFETPEVTDRRLTGPVDSGWTRPGSQLPSTNGDPDSGELESDEYLFGKYRRLGKVGGGGMGIVLLVEHLGLDQKRALKIIKSDAAANPSNRLRFKREARILGKLNHHPNAVAVHDAELSGTCAYIEMEFVDGQTLHDYLKPILYLPVRDALWILSDLCAVLGEAHGMGIVHRDIKPSNIMIVADPTSVWGHKVKVLDFGIAKFAKDATSDGALSGLQTEHYLGTYPYSSPEQLGHVRPGQQEATVDQRSDIYSLGVLLYEMLAAKRPFTGIQTKILYDHVNTLPPPFSESAPDACVPPAVEAVVRSCLEKDPANRPQSVGELLERFEAAVRASEGGTAVEELEAGPVVHRPLPGRDVSGHAEVRAWRFKRTAAVIVGSALMTSCSFVLAYVWVRPTPIVPPPPPPPGTEPSPIAAKWMEKRGFEWDKDKGLFSGWPKSIQAKNRSWQRFERNGSAYLPAGFEIVPEAGLGKTTSLPRVLRGRESSATYGKRFLLIEGGDFEMGAFDNDKEFQLFDRDEKPPTHVSMPSFYMQEFEVTIEEFDKFCQSEKDLNDRSVGKAKDFYKRWHDMSIAKHGAEDLYVNYPAMSVTYELATQYAESVGGKLPTEAQWEFAARSGGKPQLYVWSDKNARACDKANVAQEDAQFPDEVGKIWQEDRTEQGVFGLAGNVREWCQNLWRPYPWPGTAGSAVEYAIRGGSYETPTETARVTWRGDTSKNAYKAKATEPFPDVGFRVVLEVFESDPSPPTGVETASKAVAGGRR